MSNPLLFSASLFGSFTCLFAVIESPGSSSIESMVGNVGVVGILIWFFYYTLTKTIPDITSKHETMVAKLIDRFSAELEKQRTDANVREVEERRLFRESIADMAAAHEKQITKLSSDFSELAGQTTAAVQRAVDELNARHRRFEKEETGE